METRNRKILAIDDNQDNLTSLKALIYEAFPNITTLTALSGKTGLELAAKEDPDVILLDIVMPGMDGFEVCQKLKESEQLRDIPVVFVTALKGDKESRIRALECGAEAFLAKPIDESELTAQIRAMVKIKAANLERRDEKARLAALVEEKTHELNNIYKATLNLLEELEEEYELRKLSEKSLQESVQRLNFLVDNSPMATIEWDSNYLVTRWAGEAEKVFGWNQAETVGKPIMDLHMIFEEDIPIVQETMEQLTTGSSKYVVSANRNHTKDGKVINCEWYNSVLRNPQGEMVSVLSQVLDVTERKHAEEEKINLEVQLQQSQKMESVGRLAGGVAHDFNNLLTVILGGTYLALMELDPGQPLHEYIISIQKAAEKSAELTQQLLAFARKQTIMPKVLDLNQTVTGMIKMLKRLIGEDVELIWQPEANLWPIKADPSQIDQILANLCVNAKDSISNIGKIAILTGNSVVDESFRAEQADFVPGEYVHISVCDNGCGMDKKTLTHIFEPFFTTKGVGEGTGLGLATVYGAVRQNNGFIKVFSEPGAGTTFTIYLPRHVGNSVLTENENISIPAPLGLETILLVEDDLGILNMTTLLLTKQGYSVLQANTPAEAIRMAEEHAGEINLLVTDVIMPEMNGKDLANMLKSFTPKLKCLFMSGYTADVIAQHGVLDEGVHFIQKPFSLPDLANKVRETLDKKCID